MVEIVGLEAVVSTQSTGDFLILSYVQAPGCHFRLMSFIEKSTLSVGVDEKKHIGTITFTRPQKLNSFIPEQYVELGESLQELDKNEQVTIILLTGSGSYYSSGHDLASQTAIFKLPRGTDVRTEITKSISKQASFIVETLIHLKKPIIAAVNGPAVGIAVTSLALCDIVYASDTSHFTTPFMKLGFCAEGCASVLFPSIMGLSKANELLLLGNTKTAHEMEKAGFVSAVFPAASFHEQVLKEAELLASYPPNALIQTKALVRDPLREQLLEANRRELTLLVDRFLSPESINAVLQFFQDQRSKKRSKL
eukprot:TRINITY_DN5387_c0_g2_i2.p1 TRINITY_DN5387_c0_g2~~TRINITY_DN5387_c0_g2_i2.p1  ORF type:complete len:309 (+),score=51.56 TRINITY_DN5387_c0_g2_i2:3-929(+)